MLARVSRLPFVEHACKHMLIFTQVHKRTRHKHIRPRTDLVGMVLDVVRVFGVRHVLHRVLHGLGEDLFHHMHVCACVFVCIIHRTSRTVVRVVCQDPAAENPPFRAIFLYQCRINKWKLELVSKAPDAVNLWQHA